MLASVVIKIEYRRALHQGSVGILRQPSIHGFPAAKISSISCFAAAFLPGSAQYVEMAVTHSKQTTGPFLPGSRIACQTFNLLPNFGLALGTKSVSPLRPHGRS